MGVNGVTVSGHVEVQPYCTHVLLHHQGFILFVMGQNINLGFTCKAMMLSSLLLKSIALFTCRSLGTQSLTQGTLIKR